MVCRKEGVSDELAFRPFGVEFHGKVFYLVVIGFGGKVTVAPDECLCPFSGLAPVGVGADVPEPFPAARQGVLQENVLVAFRIRLNVVNCAYDFALSLVDTIGVVGIIGVENLVCCLSLRA